jgi:methylglutaconyl-CoA hydratase
LKSSCLLIENEPPLTWLKLNRPDVANSLNTELLQEIYLATQKISADKQIQIVAFIGSGTKFFSAGADLTERKKMTIAEVIDYHLLIQRTMQAIEDLPQPVIAAINGSAFGGGTELALCCDLRVMVKNAQLRLPEVKLGIIPGAGGTQRLPRLIGKSKAKEMILTGAPLSADEGFQNGLINKLFDEPAKSDDIFNESLMQYVRSWAAEIATASPLSLRQAKYAIDSGYDKNLDAGLALESRAYMRLVNTKDRLEGLSAFAEKRKPVFNGE